MSSKTTASRSVLLGRRTEADKLHGLVERAWTGQSSALLLVGEPGGGKTALLRDMAAKAKGCRLLWTAGVESQMQLAFASLHELCGPMVSSLHRLPSAQAEALGTAFGLRTGPSPDRTMIGLAVLSMLADDAIEQPVVCVVDDAQWVDRASAQVLGFVARRLAAESVVMVIALRPEEGVPSEDGASARSWEGLPQLELRGLATPDAEVLLDSSIAGTMEPRVRQRVLAETRGNPLALVELPRWFTPAELAFGPWPTRARDTSSLTRRMEEAFRRQLESVPTASRRLLLIAAAEPLGDKDLLRRAAAQLGLGPGAAIAPELSGLIDLGDTVRFRHPLIRSVVYRAASSKERHAVHAALADVTDPDVEPDRHAWHRACAAHGPDEAVANGLERAAERAIAHGGQPVAATLLERAAMLTPDPAERVRRQLGAAQAHIHAGAVDTANALITVAEHGALTELERTRIDVLHAQVGLASSRANEALPVLLGAAKSLEALDPELAMDCYMNALMAALFAGRMASGPDARAVAEAVAEARVPDGSRRRDALLQAVSARFTDGFDAAVPQLRRAVRDFERETLTLDEGVRFLWLAAVVAAAIWDERAWDQVTRRHLRVVGDVGALSAIPLALSTRVFLDMFRGDLTAASVLVEEIAAATEATQSTLASYGALGLAAFRGRERQTILLAEQVEHDVTARGEGIGISLSHWAQAVLFNGQGRYADAVAAGRSATAYPDEMLVSNWGLMELVEAASRTGELHLARDTCDRLVEVTKASDTPWARGVVARAEAQVTEGARTEELYLEAIERLDGTRLRCEAARARLLYGEWLRRAGRRADARGQLRQAIELFAVMGANAFEERARRELSATGENVRARSLDTSATLTPQELQVARLAAEGLTNIEIGAKLFISPRTVEWHLGNVFAKLGITVRWRLAGALRPGDL